MYGPLFHRQLLPILTIFLCLAGASALAAEPVGEIAPEEGPKPAAAFPLGRIDPVPVSPPAPPVEEPEYDPLFDEYDPHLEKQTEVYDPLESGNRKVYGFNRKVDQFVFHPVTRTYRYLVPGPARRSIRHVFINLNAPIYIVNNLLQLRFGDAVQTFGAFAMNLTFGIGGLFDTADGIRCELKAADFGQTMALFGVGSGPYMVIPVLGPTTARDGLGWIVDRAFHPLTYILGIPVQLMWGGGHGVSYREEVADGMAALEETSVDSYAVIRSAYAQAREQAIKQAGGADEEPTPPEAEDGGTLARTGELEL